MTKEATKEKKIRLNRKCMVSIVKQEKKTFFKCSEIL
jgi:hypothetical protein